MARAGTTMSCAGTTVSQDEQEEEHDKLHFIQDSSNHEV